MVYICSIEANISAGKSSILNRFKKLFGNESKIITLQEPVEKWMKYKDENGNSMLKKFYDDQDRYSFPFQMMALLSRIEMIDEISEKCGPDDIILVERSVLADKFVFAQMLHDDGKIEPILFHLYQEWHRKYTKNINIQKIIYLKTSPRKCHERYHKRRREGETIPLEYLEKCHGYHETMIEAISKENIDIMVLDNDEDDIENLSYDDKCQKIYDFIKETEPTSQSTVVEDYNCITNSFK